MNIRQYAIDYMRENKNYSYFDEIRSEDFKKVNNHGESLKFATYLEKQLKHGIILEGYIPTIKRYHAFLEIDNKYYDIEDQIGTEHPEELSYFKRQISTLNIHQSEDVIERFLESIREVLSYKVTFKVRTDHWQ